MTAHNLDQPKEAELERQGRSLRRLARALVADPAAADDAVQDAYVLALDRERGLPSDWLRGVVRNKIRERRRAEGRRRAREQRAPGQPARSPTDETAAGIEMQTRVMAALARVPEPHRTCVWLRYIAGREPADIAATLGIPAATVRTRTHRGLEHLREQLDAAHDGDRRTWQRLLLPLLPLDPPLPLPLGGSTAAATSSGVVWAAAAALTASLLLGAVAWLGRTPDATTSNGGLGAADVSPDSAPILDGSGLRPPDPRASSGAGRAEVGVRLSGHVLPAAEVLPDALQVYVIAKDAQFHTRPTAHAIPDSEGRFLLEVPRVRGHWIAAVSASGAQYGAVDGDAWQPERPLAIHLARPVERRVRVFDRNGALLPNALVWCMPLRISLQRAWPRPEDGRFVTFTEATNEGGALSLRVPTNGPFRLRIRDRGPVLDRIVQPGENAVDLHLQPGGVVRLSLENWSEGGPAFEGRLSSVADPGAISPPSAFREGILEFTGVPPGRWLIHATARGYRTTTTEAVTVLRGDAVVTAGTQMRRRYDIGRLSLEVFDAHGEPAPAGRFAHSGVWLRAHGARTVEWTPAHPDAWTGNRLTFKGLEQGAYDVYLTKYVNGETIAGGSSLVQIVASQELLVRIDCRPAFTRKLPDLGAFRVAHRRLVHEDIGELPLLSDWTRRAHPIGGLPLEGSELGPYPAGQVTLELWDPDGKRTSIVLSALAR